MDFTSVAQCGHDGCGHVRKRPSPSPCILQNFTLLYPCQKTAQLRRWTTQHEVCQPWRVLGCAYLQLNNNAPLFPHPRQWVRRSSQLTAGVNKSRGSNGLLRSNFNWIPTETQQTYEWSKSDWLPPTQHVGWVNKTSLQSQLWSSFWQKRRTGGLQGNPQRNHWHGQEAHIHNLKHILILLVYLY